MANLSTKTLIAAFQVMRPVHWVKNLGIFAALVFGGMLMDRQMFMRVLMGFFIFSLASSATYILNDLFDVENDRRHPIKKNRPIASGDLTPDLAVIELAFLTGIVLIGAYELSASMFILVGLYLVLQVLYSLYLKNLHVIDILIIATGFVIRVYSGAFLINAHLSVWFLLCVVSTALFLASGKRRAELGVVGLGGGTRKSLKKYTPELLDSYVTMFGNASWMSWALFTFFESPNASRPVWLFLAELSRTTTINKLLMITIPVAIFGIMRYQSLIFEGRSEAPERLLLKDTSLVASVAIWVFMVVWIMYGGVAS